MKKLYVIFLGFILTALFVTNVCAADESTMIVVNNTCINETGKIFNDKFLVPARCVFEAMGAEVKWNNKDRALVVNKDNIYVTVKLGSSKMTVNGLERSMEHTPVLFDNSLMLPANNIGEPFGYKVAYDEKNNIMFLYPENYTYICTIMPSDNFPKVIKGIDNANDEYEKIFQKAADKIIFRNVTGMIIEYPSNPFPQSSTIYNIDCFKERYYIRDLDNDNIPELIIGYVSDDGRFDDYVVYTCKNNTIYYCGNIRNVLDCGPSNEIYFYNDYPGVFVYEYRISAYMQVVLNNTVINRGNKYIPESN